MANLTLVKRDETMQTYKDGQQVNEINSVTYKVTDGNEVVGEVNVNNNSFLINLYRLEGMGVNAINEMITKMFDALKEQA